MASISSIGIGSGLDANAIVTKLVDLEKQPLTGLKTKASVLNAQMSAYGTIKSQISALADAAFSLSSPSFWNPLTVSSSNSAAVSASITGVPSQASYSMEVQQLARAQSAASASFTSGATLGTGTLTLQLGTWSAGFAGFTPGAASAMTVTIGAGEDNLVSIATKINDAAVGVTATIVKDSSGERLSIRSNTTGEASGFRIQVADNDTVNDDNAGLSRLAFDPQTGAFGMATTITTAQQARNANATLNGVPVTSGTNKFSDLIPGLSLTVGQVTTAPVEVSTSQDVTAIKKTITDFVTAYNTLNKTLSDATKYDTSTKKGSLLQGDAATVGLQNALRTLVGSSTTGAAYARLSDLGITLQRDGSLQSSAKLDTALQNVAAVKKFFTIDNSNVATNGFGLKLKAFTNGLLSISGTVANKTKALQSGLDSNAKEQTKVNDRASSVESRLKAQYSALDGKMGSLNALSSYVTQQVTLWNKNTA